MNDPTLVESNADNSDEVKPRAAVTGKLGICRELKPWICTVVSDEICALVSPRTSAGVNCAIASEVKLRISVRVGVAIFRFRLVDTPMAAKAALHLSDYGQTKS